MNLKLTIVPLVALTASASLASTADIGSELVEGLSLVSFLTSDLELSQEELSGIAALIGESEIVALGEATHGTVEESFVRAQIVKYLVTEKGFSILAIEDQVGDAFEVDAQLRDSAADPDVVLRSLVFWPWHNRELGKLLSWAHARKGANEEFDFRFMGFDTQVPLAGALRLNPYVEDLGIEFVAEGEGYNQTLKVIGGDAEPAKLARRVVKSLERRKLDQELTLCAHAVEQRFLQESRRRTREEGMAHMVRQIKKLNPRSKLILWGHNVHFSKSSDLPNSKIKSLGHHLYEEFGDAYFALGMAVGSGAYRAIDLEAKKNLANAIPAPVEGSLESLLLPRLKTPALFVPDETSRPDEGSQKLQWLPGSMAHDEQFYRRDLQRDYDALLWIPEVAASEFIEYESN